MKSHDFTSGAIVPPLMRFMLPVLLAMFLQAMYGAVDLMVVGKFCSNAEVSAVSTGSQIILSLTYFIVSFAMGITVAVGQKIGEKQPEKAGQTIGTGIVLFTVLGLFFCALGVLAAAPLAALMQAPAEAFGVTVSYIRLCSCGFLVITAYNLLGSIFRGLGDSKTPLIAVGIACVFNILGDLLFVAVWRLGAAGAALATVLAQLISVVVSLWIIRKKPLPFTFGKDKIRLNKACAAEILRIGTPIALEDFLVSASFLVILALVNEFGVTASAGIGVAEKVCAFIMLVPAAFMQSMSAFVAQNCGAGRFDRAKRALGGGIAVSFAFGTIMFFLSFFRGDVLAGIFSSDSAAVLCAQDYLKAYAIDCLLTSFLFCFIGYFNGMGKTTFVMIQGVVGAVFVRVPLAFLFKRFAGESLFLIGLATPCSTALQILLCFGAFFYFRKKDGVRPLTDRND